MRTVSPSRNLQKALPAYFYLRIPYYPVYPQSRGSGTSHTAPSFICKGIETQIKILEALSAIWDWEDILRCRGGGTGAMCKDCISLTMKKIGHPENNRAELGKIIDNAGKL